MMSQTEFKRRLQLQMNKPENQTCADCPERQPRWASLIVPPPGSPPGSLPIGTFMCLECSGSHRRLGVHITFVRSVNLDSWKEKEVIAMERGGNKKVNMIFEGKLQYGKLKTTSDGKERERYIRDKYERRKFFDAAALQKVYGADISADSDESEESSEEEEEIVVTRKKSTPVAKIPAIRAPSDAARMRAESRKARLNAYRAKEPSSHTKAVAAPQEIDLLGFEETVTPQPAAETPQGLDLFTEINTSSTPTPVTSHVNATVTTTTIDPPVQNQVQPQAKKTNEEILSMFNTPHTPYNSNNPAANAISNLTTPQMNQPMMCNMNQPYRNSFPSMMLQQTAHTAYQQNAFQFQSFNNFRMTGAVMGGTATGSTTNSFRMQQSSQTGQKLDRNGFPMM